MNDCRASRDEAESDQAESGEAESETILSASVRRRVVCLRRPDGRRWVRKEFLARTPFRRLREATKSAIGCAASQREARALAALAGRDGLVPELLSEERSGFGRRRLSLAFVEGVLLADLLPGWDRRRPLMAAIGDRLHQTHEAGWVHRDLHEGNVLVAAGGPVLIDWQRARRRGRHRRDRIRDIARFEHSLWLHDVPLGDRIRFRRAALGPHATSSGRDESRRALMREVGEAVKVRARSFRTARTRRLGRAVDGRVRVRQGRCAGLRLDSFTEADLAAALRAHGRLDALAAGRVTEPIGRWLPGRGERMLKRDHRAVITAVQAGARTVVVKEVCKGGVRRRLADWFRGSAARRGWVAGHGLALRGLATAQPLAYVERRIFGVPIRSWLVQEDLRGLWPVSESGWPESLDGQPRPEGPASFALADALAKLVMSLHRADVSHGDLQALHVLLRPRPERGFEAVLIDCDAVRFESRLSDEDRIRDLATLNASLPDRVVSPELRHRAFIRYADRLGFTRPHDEVLRDIVRASRAREQQWRGDGCVCTGLLAGEDSGTRSQASS